MLIFWKASWGSYFIGYLIPTQVISCFTGIFDMGNVACWLLFPWWGLIAGKEGEKAQRGSKMNCLKNICGDATWRVLRAIIFNGKYLTNLPDILWKNIHDTLVCIKKHSQTFFLQCHFNSWFSLIKIKKLPVHMSCCKRKGMIDYQIS